MSARPASASSLVAIIGGGPAGLMAAEVLANAGVRVELFDAMPSVGRKFLLAGVGGMNITHSDARARRSSSPATANARAKSPRCWRTSMPKPCAPGFMISASTPSSAPPAACSPPT